MSGFDVLIAVLAAGVLFAVWLVLRRRRTGPRFKDRVEKSADRSPPLEARSDWPLPVNGERPAEIEAVREEPLARGLPRGFPPGGDAAGSAPEAELSELSTSASREIGPGAESDVAEAVKLGASAPGSARPGDEFTARFVAYRANEEAEVSALLTRLSARSKHRLGVRECQWKVGTAVTVRLSGRRLEVTPAEQSFVWDGARALLEFDVVIAADAPEGTIVLKFDVLVDGIVVAGLRIDLQIGASAAATSPPANATTQAARSAFASYSSKDRERVLDRLAAVRIATGLDVFLDCLALNPGEQWKPRLEKEILGRDLFLLFWSSESAGSQWVEWEWRMALEKKGRDAMQIHPLASGVKPPAELKDLHFGDVFMLVREATEARRASTSLKPPA